MLLKSLFLSLALLCGSAYAAPSVYAAPVVPTAVQPSGVYITIGSGNPVRTCVWLTVPTGKQAVCDLASVVDPGVYPITMTYEYVADCVNGDTCWPGGVATSVPFSYNRKGVAAPTGTAVKAN